MIYIVRHGQTEKNKANVLQGRSDVPLNEAGRQQAEEVRLMKVWISPTPPRKY